VAVLHLPRSLVSMFPEAPRRTEVEAASVAELIARLDERWPGMADRLCRPGPALRDHINVFVDGRRADLDAPLEDRSLVHIIPAVSGGAPSTAVRNERIVASALP
jgi:sulfur-carrier protein